MPGFVACALLIVSLATCAALAVVAWAERLSPAYTLLAAIVAAFALQAFVRPALAFLGLR